MLFYEFEFETHIDWPPGRLRIVGGDVRERRRNNSGEVRPARTTRLGGSYADGYRYVDCDRRVEN